MKISKSIVMFVFSALFFVGCKDTASKPKAETKDNVPNKEVVMAVKPELATFTIEGMSCEIGCAKTIEEKLSGMQGVQEAKVDFEGKLATVKFDADKLSAQDLTKAVESAADGKTYKVSNCKTSKI
jgi:mercuric ion binding protein